VSQIKGKLKTIILAYKAGKDNATRTGGGSSVIAYEKELGEVLGTSRRRPAHVSWALEQKLSLPVSFSPPTSPTMINMASSQASPVTPTPSSPVTPNSRACTVRDLTVPLPPAPGSRKRKSMRETHGKNACPEGARDGRNVGLESRAYGVGKKKGKAFLKLVLFIFIFFLFRF